MPELPEVETVARQLASIVTHQIVEDIQFLDPRLGALPKEFPFAGSSIHKVHRLGKQVILHFSNNQADEVQKNFYLAVHLRMTGRLLWRPKNQLNHTQTLPHFQYVNEHGNQEDSKHRRAVICCKNGDLEFVDVRRFGTMAFSENLSDFNPIGIDPLSQEFTLPRLTNLLSRSQQTMKQWLLRQDRLVGLGNIYVCEILFRTGISPLRAANTLSKKQLKQLHQSIPEVLNLAIQHCGTTFSDFQHTDGTEGGFQSFLTVYQKEGEPCPNCQRPILRIPQNGRSTFYCPHCQR